NPDRLAARLPETPGHLENGALSAATADASEVYRPRIEPPDAATVERLGQEVPELGGGVADDFGKRMTAVRESWGEDLSDEFNLARELAPKVDEARARLDQEIARLEAVGHSPEAIQEALTSKKHPLHKESELKQLYTEWKNLADQHSAKTRKVEELAQMRRDQVQTELDRFVAEHNRANPDSPLPPVKIELANNMAAAGGYSFGEGVVVLPRAELIKASGGRDLSRAVFHEVVHSQQDMDIIRTLAAEQLTHADGAGINSQFLKEAYKDATGRDLNENWMRTVLDTANDAPPLSVARQQRAIVLADEVARTGPVAELSRDLADTASHIHNRLARLSDGARNANWNEFMADLARPGSGEEMARRLFGEGGYEAMPANLRSTLEQWKAQPKNSKGLPNNFKFEPELKDSVVAHLKSRLDTVNTRHRQLIDAYAGSRLETEAYGFDSRVRRGLTDVETDITRLPPPREYHPDRVEAPDRFRTNEIARLEQESSSFSYAVDVRYGLLPDEKTPFADMAQGEIFKQIQNHVLKAPGPNGGPSLADQGWTVLQSQKFSAADQAGGDYILLNRKTGEYHVLDATERPDKRGNIVERIVWNRGQFDMRSGTLNSSGVDLVADRIAEITAQKPILNVIDQPLPSLQRPADLIDGREQLRQWQTALRESDNRAVNSFANQDLEGVIKYYHHKLRQTSVEYKAELQEFQANGTRSVREALLEYYGVKDNTGVSGRGFNDQTTSSTTGNVKVTHNEISMDINGERYAVRVTGEQIQDLEKEIFALAIETSNSLPYNQRSAIQDNLYALRQRLNEDSVRKRAATILSEYDAGKLLGHSAPPKPTSSRVRYSQEEVNALYAASGAWNELRDSLPGTRLGDDFDEYVHLALEDLQTSPGLTAADREAARILLEGYSPDNPAGVKRVNDYLEGRDNAPWRADAGTGVRETLEARSAVADRAGVEEVHPLASDYHRIADGTEPFAAATPEFDRNLKVLQSELEETMGSWPSKRIESLIKDIKQQQSELVRLIRKNKNDPTFDPTLSEPYKLLEKARKESSELFEESARSMQKSLDDFADANGIPRFELSIEYRTDAFGAYEAGQGKLKLSAVDLIRSEDLPEADGNLNRIIATILHESKHVEQDQLVIRYLADKTGVKPGQDLAPLLQEYDRRLGRPLDPQWAGRVLERPASGPEIAMNASRAETLIDSMSSVSMSANIVARQPHHYAAAVMEDVMAKITGNSPDVLKAVNTLTGVGPNGKSNIEYIFGNQIPDSIKFLQDPREFNAFVRDEHPLLDDIIVGAMVREAIEERIPALAAAERNLYNLQPHEIEAKATQELVNSMLDTADLGRRIGLVRTASLTERSTLLTSGNTA
ncbi:MAG: hypothetical protein KC652_09160, partial [Cyanobacteria bacterium HKST-UBA01]|nr:hypothetical protein [Cyanobacteria bacterium HKST-UBA01]